VQRGAVDALMRQDARRQQQQMRGEVDGLA
jgi:hypothetical protein